MLEEIFGNHYPWVSSLGSDFNYDFGVAFTEEQQRNGADYNYRHVDKAEPQKEGMSVFALQNSAVHHTYSTYARGTETLMGTYRFLDLAQRQERGRSRRNLVAPPRRVRQALSDFVGRSYEACPPGELFLASRRCSSLAARRYFGWMLPLSIFKAYNYRPT